GSAAIRRSASFARALPCARHARSRRKRRTTERLIERDDRLRVGFLGRFGRERCLERGAVRDDDFGTVRETERAALRGRGFDPFGGFLCARGERSTLGGALDEAERQLRLAN